MKTKITNIQNQSISEKFKAIFEAEKEKLLFSKKGLLSSDFQLQREDMVDEGDMTSSVIEQNMQLKLRSREALFLKNIEKSLKRIQEGTFGECEDCGDEIELRRLEVRPTTKLCIECKEEQEQSERNFSDGRQSKSGGQLLTLRA